MKPVDALSRAFAGALRSDVRGRGELLTLPLAMSHGNLVQLYVEQLDDDSWLISDQGQAATELAIAGVNLDTNKAAANSWGQLLRSLNFEPSVMRDASGYELSGIARSGALGSSLLVLGEAVVRGEALCALAPAFRAKRFRDVIVQAAGRHDLSVMVDAPMPTKHRGTRPVSLMIEAKRSAYVQAVSGKGSALEGFDKAQAVFSSAAVSRDSLVAVLANRIRLEPWQWQTLQDLGQPVLEHDLDQFLIQLAA